MASNTKHYNCLNLIRNDDIPYITLSEKLTGIILEYTQ